VVRACAESDCVGVGSALKIKALACDVDGTLLSTKHEFDARTAELIIEVVDNYGITFFPATGKSRAGALNSFGPPLATRLGTRSPGVFLQGLIVYGRGGQIVYESTLSARAIEAIIQQAHEEDVEWVGYLGDRLIVERQTALTDSLTVYHEPRPELLSDVRAELGILEHETLAFNKMLVIHRDPAAISAMRPRYEQRMKPLGVVLTQAQADMLEMLPPGASKGDGVRRLLEHLELDAGELMAIGDAENDLEMLALARVGVAMGNGLPSVKKIATWVAPSNNELGVAAAIRKFILLEDPASGA